MEVSMSFEAADPNGTEIRIFGQSVVPGLNPGKPWTKRGVPDSSHRCPEGNATPRYSPRV
jgi:hypothetical protein